MGILDDLDDDEDGYDDEDGDLKRCQDCGKLHPREELCYINGAFGDTLLVCPHCARRIVSSGDSSWNE